jgi:hypothetical protein
VDFNREIKIATGTATSAYLNLNSITTAPTVGTPFSGYVVESVAYANAGVSGFMDSIAQRDGAEANIALLGTRQIQMIVQVYGSSSADFYDKLNALNSSLQPYPSFATSDDGFRSLDFDQATLDTTAYTSGFINMRMKVRPTSIPTYNLNNDLVTPRTTDRGISTKAAISLMAKDPRKTRQTATTGTINVSSSSETTTTLTNNGNYVAYPTFVFVNAATASRTATISTSAWTSVITLPASSTITVDADARTVKIGTALRMDLVTTGTTSMPYLLAGATVLTVSAMDSVTGTFSFNEAWL